MLRSVAQNLTRMQNNSNKKPACYAPWITTYENAIGKINPCCDSQGWLIPNKEKKSLTFEERWNAPEMVKFREILMTGELPDNCGNCLHNEKNGAVSLRQEYDLFEPYVELDKFKLIHMDYRESNICNMSCKMCGTDLSSTHALSQGMYGKTGIMNNPTNPQIYLDNLENVRSINFAGGEPALMDSFYDVLNAIIDRDLQKNIDVSLVTNGSVIMRNNDNWIEKITQGGFKAANIAVSVDCIEDAHNYWRQKNTWKSVHNTLEYMIKCRQEEMCDPGVRLSVRAAIGWPNAYAAKDVFDTYTNQVDNVRHNFVNNPNWLSIDMLPIKHIKALIEHWADYPFIQKAFSQLNEPSVDHTKEIAMKKWKRSNEMLDNYNRDMTFADAFPEFAEFYNSIIVPKTGKLQRG